jgi:uncharacterized membrane protein (DUF373 family)
MAVERSTNKTNPLIEQYLDKIQSLIYLAVALVLIIMAMIAFYIVLKDLSNILTENASILALDSALEDLLVILIITALIQTVLVYIKSHQLDPRLILGVGLTAVIRRVLVFGVNQRPWEDIALTALLMLVLIIGIYLIGDRKLSNDEK